MKCLQKHSMANGWALAHLKCIWEHFSHQFWGRFVFGHIEKISRNILKWMSNWNEQKKIQFNTTHTLYVNWLDEKRHGARYHANASRQSTFWNESKYKKAGKSQCLLGRNAKCDRNKWYVHIPEAVRTSRLRLLCVALCDMCNTRCLILTQLSQHKCNWNRWTYTSWSVML